MKNTIVLGTLVGLTLLALAVIPVLAGSSTDVTINATPSYISFSSAPTSWILNGITGSAKVSTNTLYYANPGGDTVAPSATVVDGECQFTWTNDSNVNLNITVNCIAFTGGSCDMTNSNSGSNGATTYGAYAWYSGMTYANKVIVKSSGSAILYSTVTPGEDKKWGAEILTRTDPWTGSTTSSATMTISAVAA